jgi:hypothetical protein
MIWYVNRTNKDTGILENKSHGFYGPFESNKDVSKHYAKDILSWDEEKLNFTEDYFYQVYKHDYYEFLIKHEHIVVFENEPTQTDIEVLENNWSLRVS